MRTHDVESRLTDLLHRHAEDAMSRTDTQAEILRFNADIEDDRSRSKRRLAAVVGLSAATVAAAVVWAADLTGNRAAPAPAADPERTVVQTAQGFVDAFVAGDARRAASYLAPGVPWEGWRVYIRRNQAWSVEQQVQPCREQAAPVEGTHVACPYDVQALHSEELGLGPFGGNAFIVLVMDGEVVWLDDGLAWETNGFGDHVAAVDEWIRVNHPEDHAFMSTDEQELDPEQLQRWLRLWEQRSQEYAEAMS